MSYHHGVRVIEKADGQRPISEVSTDVIGLIATGDDADVATFPLNTPVLLTDVMGGLGKAGDSGTLARSLDSIVSQSTPKIVVVRVADSDDEDQLSANVIGDNVNGRNTGMQALLSAEQYVGVRPRILGAPGLDTLSVAQRLASVAEKLRAFAYVNGWECETRDQAVQYRNHFNQRELMLIWPDFLSMDVRNASINAAPSVAHALGLRAKLDTTVGWHKTLSNVPVSGVVGLTKDVSWDLQSASTDSNVLNSNQITTIAHNDGFRFWGSRTCADDNLFIFENYTRTAQMMADTMAQAHMWALDQPMHPQLIRDMVENINAKLREWRHRGWIVDGSAWFDADANPGASLQNGKLVVDYDYTPMPPLEDLTLQQHFTGRYFANYAERIAAAV